MIRRPPRSTLLPYTTLFRSQHLREAGAEVGDPGLGHRVGDEVGARVVGVHRRRVDDRRPRLHVRDRVLGQREHRRQVQRHRVVPLLVRDLLERVVAHLEGRVVDQDVDLAELLDRLRDDRLLVGAVGEVTRHQHALPAGLPDVLRGVLSVLVLVEVRNQDVGALPGEGDRDGAADAAVAAGDDRRLAGQPAGTAVALLPVVGLRCHLPQRPGDVLLLGGLGFRAGLGHGVLQVRGRCRTSPTRPPAAGTGASLTGRDGPSGTLSPTMTTTAPPLLDDPADLSALRARGADPDELFSSFAAWAEANGTVLYPHQEEALIELVSGAHVVLATPTGSGKSLVATGAQYAALAAGTRIWYTAPIKALVSEKFFALCGVFGAENVGMLTGDAAVNRDAPIIACTAEVLANIALREGADADVGLVVMDEFHFYGDPDRGWAWQVPLLELPRAQFLLMSATLGDTGWLREDLTRRTGRPTALVASAERPVPLHHYYATTPMHETIQELLDTRQAPVYVVHFTQAAALERAQALMSVNVCTKEEKAAIADTIGGFRFTTSFGTTLSRLVRHGIGVHHAGMLPKYRRLVEQLAQAGLLKVICGTDTLGVGINVPIRTVVFSALSKYDGTRTRLLNAREFHQIAGRAGRAGYDTAGTVVVQAPEHEVENLRQFAKVADDPKKRRKLVRKKAPEGMVPWSKATMERLVAADPEPLTRNMPVSPAMVLDVVDRPGAPFVAMRRLLTENHEPRKRQLRHVREAIGVARSLLQAGVLVRLEEPEPDGRRYRLTVDLPPDFALNQPLSTFALAAIELLDPESETYALDVVSVIEATLDDPRQILGAQLSKAKGEAVAQMKAEGIEYDERMELLEEVSYPKPLEELLGRAYDVYRRTNPWGADAALSPKSVVREMWERAFTV